MSNLLPNKSIPVSAGGLRDGVELVPGSRTRFCWQSGDSVADGGAGPAAPGCLGKQHSQLYQQKLQQQRLVETLVGEEDGLTAFFSFNRAGSYY